LEKSDRKKGRKGKNNIEISAIHYNTERGRERRSSGEGTLYKKRAGAISRPYKRGGGRSLLT